MNKDKIVGIIETRLDAKKIAKQTQKACDLAVVSDSTINHNAGLIGSVKIGETVCFLCKHKGECVADVFIQCMENLKYSEYYR